MDINSISSDPITILLYLGVALVSARILGEIFERIKLSSIIGELLAGILFGGPFLGIIGANTKMFVDIDVLKQFSQIGIIILLFIIGLEINTKNLRKSGKKSLIISIVEVTLALAGGFLTGYFLLDFTIPQAIFFGTMFTATSIGVTVRTLNDIGRLNTTEGEILLSTAILDDFIALFLVLIFSSALFPAEGEIWYISLFINLGILAALIVVVVLLLPWLLKILENRFRIFSNSSTKFLSTGIIFGLLALLVYFAEILGISGAIVAFLFGLSLQKNKVLVGEIKDIFIKMGEGVFLPLFFFGVGATFLFDFSSFSPIILLAVPIAIIAKGIGTFTGTSIVGMKPKDSAKIAIGMMPRAEIVLVIAEIGLLHGIFNQSIYSMAVLLVFVTIIITPIALRLVFKKPKVEPPDNEEIDIKLTDESQATETITIEPT
ncbi:MAG: cation:proton antiporter [Candidatus Heimdallarchaeota archaeon]